jgi:hypothetical protein
MRGVLLSQSRSPTGSTDRLNIFYADSVPPTIALKYFVTTSIQSCIFRTFMPPTKSFKIQFWSLSHCYFTSVEHGRDRLSVFRLSAGRDVGCTLETTLPSAS